MLTFQSPRPVDKAHPAGAERHSGSVGQVKRNLMTGAHLNILENA